MNNRWAIKIAFITGYNIENNKIEMNDILDIVDNIGGKADYFDHKEWRKGQNWEDKMKQDGFIVNDISFGSDEFNLLAIPPEHLDMMEILIKKIGGELVYPNWDEE